MFYLFGDVVLKLYFGEIQAGNVSSSIEEYPKNGIGNPHHKRGDRGEDYIEKVSKGS
jgi:hypothetical protein